MLSHLIRMFRAWRRYDASLRELNSLGDREAGGYRACPFRHRADRLGNRPPLSGSESIQDKTPADRRAFAL